MTVIAAFQFPDYPMVMSDMLLSGPERPDTNTSLPVVGDVRNVFPEGSGWTITGVVQKMAIIADNCVVVWAGSRLGAQAAIRSLKELAQAAPLNSEIVREFMANLPEDILRLGINLLGFVKDEGGFTQIALEPDAELELSDGTPVSLAGSGTRLMHKFLSRSRILGLDANFHPAACAYAIGLQTAALHLRMEIDTDEQLLHFFGGFYEIAVWNGERFTKDRGVTYIMWEAKWGLSNSLALPTLIITTNYINDVLLLKAQPFIWTSTDDKFKIGRVQIHAASPVDQRINFDTVVAPKDIEHKTPWMCHCICATRRDGTIGRAALVNRPKYDGNDLIELDVKEGVVLRINWKKEFWQHLEKAIEDPWSPACDS